jgi:hypothetical protein
MNALLHTKPWVDLNEQSEKLMEDLAILDDGMDDNQPAVITQPDFEYYDTSVLNLKCVGDFFEESTLVQRQITEVVDALGPISKADCFSIVSKAWGFARKGNRIEEYLSNCEKVAIKTKSNQQVFFWKSKESKETIASMRMPLKGEQRHPSSIAPEELSHGLLMVLRDNYSLQKSVLYREVVKMVGYSRITQENMENVDTALSFLVSTSQVEVKEDMVSLTIC